MQQTTLTAGQPPLAEHALLADRYRKVRSASQRLCQSLVPEDYVVQSMPDVSPTKWHLAHTSWFFETFILVPHCSGYRVFDPHFAYLFNSYYITVGDRHCRQNRGQLSRPTVQEVYRYRQHVDEALLAWLEQLDETTLARVAPLLEIGLHHEQQHQELMLTDIKHVFWVNPMRPAYAPPPPDLPGSAGPVKWVGFDEGVRWVGHDGAGFAFDNESPRHRVFVHAFAMASRLVTCGEYLRFIEDGGYRTPSLWLSMGWAMVQQEKWDAPLYWIRQDEQWLHHTLWGLRPVHAALPVCHVSYFEADAFARWAGARLPTEFEWETAALEQGAAADEPALHFVEEERNHPMPPADDAAVRQLLGDAWEWTSSSYAAYPGYRPPAGALGEYNGKFMCNQYVLRGGSCATPRSHIRPTYRNFFPPDARWQFSGLRLAREA